MECQEISSYLWDYYYCGHPNGPDFQMPERRQHCEELCELEDRYRRLLEEQDAERRKQEVKEELLQLQDEYEALLEKQAACQQIRYLTSQRECECEGFLDVKVRERILRQRRQDVLAQQEVDDQIFQVLAEKQQLLQEQDCLVYHFPDKGQPFWVTKKEFEHRMQMIDDAHADLQARIKAQVTVRNRCPGCRPRSAPGRPRSPPRHTGRRWIGS